MESWLLSYFVAALAIGQIFNFSVQNLESAVLVKRFFEQKLSALIINIT